MDNKNIYRSKSGQVKDLAPGRYQPMIGTQNEHYFTMVDHGIWMFQNGLTSVSKWLVMIAMATDHMSQSRIRWWWKIKRFENRSTIIDDLKTMVPCGFHTAPCFSDFWSCFFVKKNMSFKDVQNAPPRDHQRDHQCAGHFSRQWYTHHVQSCFIHFSFKVCDFGVM